MSHSCVIAENQSFFCHVEVATGAPVTLLAPRTWRDEYTRHRLRRHSCLQGALLPADVLPNGHVVLHVYLRRLRALLRRVDPSVIYAHHEPYALATYQLFRAALTQRHARVGFFSTQNMMKRHPWPLSATEAWVFRRADFAVASTPEVAGVLRRKGYAGRLEVIPYGIETSNYRERSRKPLPPRGNPAGLTLGFLGRLTQEKGVDVLIHALAHLPHTRLVVAGAGPQADALRRLAAELGVGERVDWLGYVPHTEASRFFAGVDLLAVPSRTTERWKEQFGRVVIEALASATPVITSDSGELPRLVGQTGGGWVTPEGDAELLAALVQGLIRERESLAARALDGQRAVERLYDSRRLAERFAALIAEC